MIRVTVTDVELGAMSDYLDKFIQAGNARDRQFAERGLVSFLLSFNRMRHNGAIPKGAGWKIQYITTTHTAETMSTELLFQLNSVTDRIKIDQERKEHNRSVPSSSNTYNPRYARAT